MDTPGPHPGAGRHRHPPVPDGEAYEQLICSIPTPGSGTPGRKKLESAMDAIRKKYGGDAIVSGAARPERGGPLP